MANITTNGKENRQDELVDGAKNNPIFYFYSGINLSFVQLN